MKKDTGKLLEELKHFGKFEQFYNHNEAQLATSSLSDLLQAKIAEKGLSLSEVVKKSEMSEVYAYQIVSGVKASPAREKVLCLLFGMGLSCDEAQTLLKQAGYAPLYVKQPFDAIVFYGFVKQLGVVEVNNLLFEYGQRTLG